MLLGTSYPLRGDKESLKDISFLCETPGTPSNQGMVQVGNVELHSFV